MSLVQFSITYRRRDAKYSDTWHANIWARDWAEAYDLAKDLETKIPAIYDVVVDGVILGTIEKTVNVLAVPPEKELPSLEPWFLWHQLKRLKENKIKVDLHKLLKEFEDLEEYSICQEIYNLIKLKA